MARGGSHGSRGRRQPRHQVSTSRVRTDKWTGRPKVADVASFNADPEPESSLDSSNNDSEIESVGIDDEASRPSAPGRSYSALLQSFTPVPARVERNHKRKRRRLDTDADEVETLPTSPVDNVNADLVSHNDNDEDEAEDVDHDTDGSSDEKDGQVDSEAKNLNNRHGQEEEDDVDNDEASPNDNYMSHFSPQDNIALTRKITQVNSKEWHRQNWHENNLSVTSATLSSDPEDTAGHDHTISWKSLGLKGRLQAVLSKSKLGQESEALARQMFAYRDILYGARTVKHSDELRRLVSLHVLNHVYKGRDRVLKNNERLAKSDDQDLDLRDQGFTRPKVLVLLETRQACYKYIETLTELCGSAQQENKKRFRDAFSSHDRVRDDMPDDYKELFDGNRDDNFKIAIKLTRKTVKYFSAFYASDIIFASPLGLRGVIENADPNKSDSDFLSSIEVVVIDQADAMLMQNWDHVEHVLSHLNLQPRDAHGCDFSRVRSWYLDNNAKYLCQKIVLSAYLTPELNRLYNATMLNVGGKIKFAHKYKGALLASSGLNIRQTFSRYTSSSPVTDPDERFAYFSSAVVPALNRIATSVSSEDPAGILLYVPSYLDFVRVRNFMQTSPTMQNVSSGALSEYDSVSDARRTRSHFLSGRYSVLLYSERAHHFNRFRIRGVKRVVFYALPENPRFYEEVVGGYLGTTLSEGRCEASDMKVRSIFSRLDGLKLERVVGTDRVAGLLGAKAGDTFDFI